MQTGDAEVQDFRLAVLIDQHIGRLEIAMHDPASMRVIDRPRQFGKQCDAGAQIGLIAHLFSLLATPLGLGKPNALLNALYRRVAAEPARRLTIFTALSLARPHASSFLERRFLEPFVERHFGSGQAELDHVAAMRADRLPANIHVREFYFQSGAMLGSRSAQSDHVNLNYTHVARDLAAARVNTIVQLVARRGEGEGLAVRGAPG